jgi:hypothetical protein
MPFGGVYGREKSRSAASDYDYLFLYQTLANISIKGLHH